MAAATERVRRARVGSNWALARMPRYAPASPEYQKSASPPISAAMPPTAQ